MKLSVVIPVYNAENTIADLVNEVNVQLSGIQHEIILVNDGSKDKTSQICEKIAAENATVNYIELKKNFGEHNAVMCGLNFAKGEYTAIIDDDFQNPPSEILKLFHEIEKGYDVVYSQYDKKQHSFFRNLSSKFNDKVANVLLKKPKGLYLSSFKIIRKDLIDVIVEYKGPFPYIDGLILRSTNRISSTKTEHHKRTSGSSNYTLGKLLKLYFNMFFNFSVVPLRFITLIGFIAFIVGALLSVYFIVNKLLHPDEVLGWTSLIVAILTLSGVQLMFLGLIGEYIGKQYLDQNKTPQFVIHKKTFRDTP